MREPALGFFSNQNYRYWVENDGGQILWIHGGPGCGKTVLSAVLSKELISDRHTCFDQEFSVAYFFFDAEDDRLTTSCALLTSLLAQLLRQDPNTLVHFCNEAAYFIDKEKTVWTLDMLWRVFKRIVNDKTLKPMFVIIDAIGMLLNRRSSCCGYPIRRPAKSNR
jgi:Cdc6-like AAA superfamily ATPase